MPDYDRGGILPPTFTGRHQRVTPETVLLHLVHIHTVDGGTTIVHHRSTQQRAEVLRDLWRELRADSEITVVDRVGVLTLIPRDAVARIRVKETHAEE